MSLHRGWWLRDDGVWQLSRTPSHREHIACVDPASGEVWISSEDRSGTFFTWLSRPMTGSADAEKLRIQAEIPRDDWGE